MNDSKNQKKIQLYPHSCWRISISNQKFSLILRIASIEILFKSEIRDPDFHISRPNFNHDDFPRRPVYRSRERFRNLENKTAVYWKISDIICAVQRRLKSLFSMFSKFDCFFVSLQRTY